MNKKLRFIAGTTFMLAAGVVFGKGYGNIGVPYESTVVRASSDMISEDHLWEINASGEIYKYLGNQKEITIPETITCNGVSYPVTKIYDDAIKDNDTVEVINFSSNVTYYGLEYFDDCNNLREFNVPESNPYFMVKGGVLYTRNEEGAPDRLIAIPSKAELDSLIIDDTVWDFNIYGISGSDTIKYVYIGKGMRLKKFTNIFSDFTAIEKIEVSSENKVFTSQDGILYDKDMTSLYLYPSKKNSVSYTFPKSVTYVDGYAFHNGNENLKNINFTNYLGTATKNSCYFGKLNLTSINGCSTLREYEALSTQTKDYLAQLLKNLENQPVIIKLCNEAVDRAIAENVTDNMTSYEKIKAMHDYVCSKVHYAPKSKNVDNDQYHAIPSIFLTDETVCEGYALGFSLILDRLGFESHVIYATEHAWNLVKLNDIWVAIDVCWDDGNAGWNYNYFLVTYDEMQDGPQIDKYHVAYSVYGTERFKGYDLKHMPNDGILPDYNPMIGDLDMNGTLDMYDLQHMSNEIRGYTIITQEGGTYYNVKADMDRDGDIDSDDYDALYAKVYA